MIVRIPENLSAEKLTNMLHARGLLADGHVVSVTVSPRVFSGAIAELSRLRVSYSSPCALPDTLLIKITKEDLHSEHLDRGRREVEFYTATLGASLAIPVCLDARIDQESGHSHVIIEDLSGSHVQTTRRSLPHWSTVDPSSSAWPESMHTGGRVQTSASDLASRSIRTKPNQFCSGSIEPSLRSWITSVRRCYLNNA